MKNQMVQRLEFNDVFKNLNFKAAASFSFEI